MSSSNNPTLRASTIVAALCGCASKNRTSSLVERSSDARALRKLASIPFTASPSMPSICRHRWAWCCMSNRRASSALVAEAAISAASMLSMLPLRLPLLAPTLKMASPPPPAPPAGLVVRPGPTYRPPAQSIARQLLPQPSPREVPRLHTPPCGPNASGSGPCSDGGRANCSVACGVPCTHDWTG